MKTAETVPITSEQAASWRPNKRQRRLEQQRASRATQSRRAATAPLPGPLREAFAAPPREMLGLKLQPVTATHIAALVEIKNPFVDGIRFGLLAANSKTAREKKSYTQKAAAVANTIEDAVEVLLIFTSTPDQVRQSLAAGRDSIRRAARLMMDGFPPFPLDWLGGALASHYMASFATAIQHQTKEPDAEPGKINFPTPARSRTDLAGSSTSSAR